MSTKEIIKGINSLPINKRLMVIEKAIKSLRSSTNNDLAKAAKALLDDYKNDKELTAFTALDADKLYETK